MKFTALITAEALQINLVPEAEHEKEFVKTLEKYHGEVSIHTGVSVEECRGGYLRVFGESKDVLAITIRKGEGT